MSKETPKLSKKEIRNELWRRAELKFLLHPVQKEMYDRLKASKANSISVWLLSRQSGKTWLLTVMAIEAALQKKNSIIKLVTDTKMHVKTIFEPKFREILSTCPDEIRPSYSTSEFKYQFPNGSQIQMAGSDNKNYERLRGGTTDLILIDEAGFCNDLKDMIKSVLLPTTIHTGGKIVLSSTPPKDPAHPFIEYIEDAAMRGTLTKKTILQNPMLKQDQIDYFINELGGINSEECRRELFCELVKSETTSVIPEFTEELKKLVTKEWPTPPHFDTYVAMDLGGKDLTAVLFGYFDFRADKIIIQDEIVMDFRKSGNNIEQLVKQIKAKEELLWTDKLSGELKKVHSRVSDVNPIVLNEIRKYSNNYLSFQVTKKDDADAAINNLRALISSRKIIIDPKCVTLLRHLENVRWSGSTTRREFARSPDDFHYDFVHSLIYLVRSINFTKNPYPSHYDYNLKDLYVANPNKLNGNNQLPTSLSTPQKHLYATLFNVPKKRKW